MRSEYAVVICRQGAFTLRFMTRDNVNSHSLFTPSLSPSRTISNTSPTFLNVVAFTQRKGNAVN